MPVPVRHLAPACAPVGVETARGPAFPQSLFSLAFSLALPPVQHGRAAERSIAAAPASPLLLLLRCCSCVTAATATSLPLLLRRCYCCCAAAAAALLQLVAGAEWSGHLGRSWAKSSGPASAQAGPGTPPPLLLAAGEPQAGRSLPFPALAYSLY
jgi:hypothetical protein